MVIFLPAMLDFSGMYFTCVGDSMVTSTPGPQPIPAASTANQGAVGLLQEAPFRVAADGATETCQVLRSSASSTNDRGFVGVSKEQ